MKETVSDPCSILYKDYYETITFSKEISSYWRKYCALQNVERTNEGYQLRGIGFGDFQEKNMMVGLMLLWSRFLTILIG